MASPDTPEPAPMTRSVLRHVSIKGGHLTYLVDEPVNEIRHTRSAWKGQPVPAITSWTAEGICRGYLLKSSSWQARLHSFGKAFGHQIGQKIAIIGIFITAVGNVFGQQSSPLELGALAGNRIAISTGGANQRIGSFVFVRAYYLGRDNSYGGSNLIMLSCNGLWMSTSIQFTYRNEKTTGFAELERYAREREDQLPLDVVYFLAHSENKLHFAPLVSKQYPNACKFAGREPRNQIIPVAESKAGENEYQSIAIVSGSSAKNGDIVDAWIRHTNFRLEDIRDITGRPIKINGVTPTIKKATGNYRLDRSTFDCKNRRMGTSESFEYRGTSSTPESWATPRENLKLSSVVPGSVGETQLDAICLIY